MDRSTEAPAQTATRTRQRLVAWGWACAAAAVPIAWWLQAGGFGIAVHSPLRDIARLAIAAAAEEIVFRGGLQRLLQRLPSARASRLGVSGANLLASLVFSAAHLWAHPPLVAVGIFPVSLLLGISLERSGALRWPMALHLWFNLALYGASWWGAAPSF